MLEDTIAAIGTPLGEGGIGIVRVSGKEAIAMTKKIFNPKYNNQWDLGPGFRMILGSIVDPVEKKIIDEVLVSIMRQPKSFTGEDVIEINCHGGILPLRKTLDLLIDQGARLAEAGQFTKRAFLNGKLDLAQAESIIDVITAKTDKALSISINQLQGKLSLEISSMQKDLLEMLALIEANIDFPEDDVEDILWDKMRSQVIVLIERIEKLLSTASYGRIYRDGVSTVIIGKPNVGKSSLLNALLRENRAIVTDIPGTTRDVIEEFVNIKGIPLKIIDTAGLRETEDTVEKIGVEKTKSHIQQADLILLMLDASAGITPEDKKIINLIKNNKSLILINKMDLEHDKMNLDQLKQLEGDHSILEISVLKNQGLDELEDKIVELVMGGQVVVGDQVLINNQRHKQALVLAKKHLKEIFGAIDLNTPPDLISIDLKAAWEALGEINGSTVTEDIINKIFEDFCIGK